MDLHVTSSSVGTARVVALEGVADLAAVPALHAALTRVTSELDEVGTVVVDLDSLTLLDDAAVGLLVGAAARALDGEAELVVVCTNQRVCERLQATRVDRIVRVATSIATAVSDEARRAWTRGVSTTEPYVAVIFTSQRTGTDADGYAAMAERMDVLAREQPGYRGIDSARSVEGTSITVSYWATEHDARCWKQVGEHLAAQNAGRDRWYDHYHLRVATVTREYEWTRPTTLLHVAMPDDWAAARTAGTYAMSTRGVTLAAEGFIHCSFDHQLLGVANRFYADVDELVVLRLDPMLLGSEVVVEPPFPGSVEHFPHIYGPIPLAAVVTATPWQRGPDGWRLD